MSARDLLQRYYDHLSEEHDEKPVRPSASVNNLPYRDVKAHHAREFPACEWRPGIGREAPQ